jgi:hypothetical protein
MPDCLAERGDGHFAASLAPAALPESNRALILNHTRREKQKAPDKGPFHFLAVG